jgi:hypothetical protein
VDDWPPPEARVRAALWQAEGCIERREYFAAARALSDVFDVAPVGERGVVRGLHHLAAAGYKHADGDDRGARRQLAHARRRLEPFLPAHDEVDLAALLDLVTQEIQS